MSSETFQFVMRTGPNPGEVFSLTKNEIYIGRDVNNDIAVNDQEVSRKHARLVMQAGGYVLEDLGSTNGTYVNGQRLMGPHVLRPGETVMLGENVSMVLEAGYDADATIVSQAPAVPSYDPTPPPQETYTPPPQQPTTAPLQPAQVTPSPATPYYEPPQEEKRDNRTLYIAGCGCLVVLLCLVLAGGLAFDTLDLYCTPPFNALSPMIYTCP
ncbi:MAG: FHA domain-containing protein [Anaerolineales bacterium]|nr:FHA domain-containing protein [Anaerolineales bacterium]